LGKPLAEQTSRTESGLLQQSMNLPIFIGISGKRVFDKTNAEADREIAAWVADRFRDLFKKLEDDFPEVPKIVLSGAAFGADPIAAEIALECNWRVTVVLPFERALFEEDFRPPNNTGADPAWQDRYAEHARTFERILDDPRVQVRELPALAVKGGGAATADLLSRDSRQYDKTLRRNHYEQVGQFIAEAATIMIAVMSSNDEAEKSEATGGTARIVAYRRAGRADAAGTEVARRSAVLRDEWPRVAPPPAGFVWLIDPDDAKQPDNHAGRSASGYPVRVLPPLGNRLVEEVYGGAPGKDMPGEQRSPAGPLWRLKDWIGAIATDLGVYDRAASAEAGRRRASLILAEGLKHYHRAAGASGTDLPESALPTELLAAYRTSITVRQRRVNEHVRSGFNRLAFLFVLAILMFEIFEKFFYDWPMLHPALLGGYLLILVLIGLTAGRAWWKRWSEIAEDYRAIAEMLRVQRAWWAAGLTRRVDREHLQGVDQDLALIRDYAKTIISYALLCRGWKEPARAPDWEHVRGTSTQPRDLRDLKRSPQDWIGSQLWFFVNKTGEREQQINANDALSWSMFVASGMLALLLLAWTASPSMTNFLKDMAHIPLPFAAAVSFDPSFTVWIVFAILMIYFRYLNHDVSQGWGAMTLTFIFGILAAGFLFLGLVTAGPLMARVADLPESREAVTSAVQVTLVVLSALAGALRYRVERLNVEGEALEYRDAQARFERAEKLLAPGSDPATGTPADEDDARRLVDELGRLALAENEAWLKSRRERPLTPVVG
jgi:hypothetical protein